MSGTFAPCARRIWKQERSANESEAEPFSGADVGGRPRFAILGAVGRRHRSLFTLDILANMKTKKRLIIPLVGAGIPLLCYVAGYLHFVHPMPVHIGGANGPESVEPVFQGSNPKIIGLFRPAVAFDRELFPGRWELARFQLPPTDLAGLQKMAPFRAKVASVGRTMPYTTGISTLHLGLRLETGHFLQIDEPRATEQMFAIAGCLQDYQLHEFPKSWFNAKIAK